MESASEINFQHQVLLFCQLLVKTGQQIIFKRPCCKSFLFSVTFVWATLSKRISKCKTLHFGDDRSQASGWGMFVIMRGSVC